MPQSVTQKGFVRGVVATSGIMSQPKGSVPRGSNLLLTKRGSLRTCDGSLVLYENSGALQSNAGKITANFLFQPIGVSSYYLTLAKALTKNLGAPRNLAVVTAAGGTLSAGTYFYKVTALDGAGGETTPSSEVSIVTGAGGKNTLTWNVVPNATLYRVYRSATTGTEMQLLAAALPVSQVGFGTLTVTFVDDGTGNNAAYNVSFLDNTGAQAQIELALPALQSPSLPVGATFTYAGGTPNTLNGQWQVLSLVDVIGSGAFGIYIVAPVGFSPPAVRATGGTFTPPSPPAQDNTQQMALYRMPVLVGLKATVPVPYDNSNIVALFPADVLPVIGTGGGGGSGGGGGRGGGGSSGGSSTPSGGIAGNVSFIPQMLEFTNQAVMALGNGFPPQVYSDPNTTDNKATTSTITNISVDANGVVTVVVSGSHGIATQVTNPGANVIISGFGGPNVVYNGTFPIIQIVNATTLKLQNVGAIGAGASSGGTCLTTTIPLYSNFTPAFPNWSATTVYGVNNVVQPSPANSHYYKAIQGGTSGGAQPTFPTGTGQRVVDGSVIWQEAGLVNSAAPAPPGGSHIGVYSGALFVFDTSPFNVTATGLDGPCSLRMSDINNLNSWNPINQAFLDKDDGTEGMGLTSFTIAAQGIAPQGSLVALKNYSTYQILGLFGSPNFTIQRVKTDMGCIAPRTIQYVPGFGIMRMTHLGFGVFDGVDDRVVSEEVRPYLFPSNDLDLSDITVMDSNWSSVSWAAQTANPPLYACAIPIGNSNGALTRIICYDLVLKAWATIDLPFSISTFSQFRTTSANPVTVMGGFNDGALSRWQAGDVTWDTGATGVRSPSVVSWSLESPTLSSNDLDERLYIRRLQVRGINTNSTVGITVGIELDGAAPVNYTGPVLSTGDFETEIAIGATCLRAEAVISGTGDVELFGWSWGIVPKPSGVPLVLT